MRASVVLPCDDLAATLAFFTERFGFRLDAIHPADAPRVAEISGHGLSIRLERGSSAPPGVLRLASSDPATLAGGAAEVVAPNGTRVQVVASDAAPVAWPEARRRFTLSKRSEARWGEGRAGMRYHDLLPDRDGGRFVVSHVAITEAGPVPDYVHFHEITFQLIVCVRGWVRVVYEDQGPPFVLEAGDAVLQPPRIRHRVLESSADLEVVEITAPAEHETRVDHALELPTPAVRADRSYGGQRFVRHVASRASWRPAGKDGIEAADLGIAAATAGTGGARAVRVRGGAALEAEGAPGDLHFAFVTAGNGVLEVAPKLEENALSRVEAGDAFVLPGGARYVLRAAETDLELLEVTLPAPPLDLTS